jgi:hypothetical protein
MPGVRLFYRTKSADLHGETEKDGEIDAAGSTKRGCDEPPRLEQK